LKIHTERLPLVISRIQYTLNVEVQEEEKVLEAWRLKKHYSVLQGLQRLRQRHNPQTPSPLEPLPRRVHHCRTPLVRPLAEDPLEVPRSALEDDGADGHERPVLDGCGEDGVVLREAQGVAERGELGLGAGADDDVQLEEGVEDVDAVRGEVRLAEGRDFEDLELR
jgi:hypothetical protein